MATGILTFAFSCFSLIYSRSVRFLWQAAVSKQFATLITLPYKPGLLGQLFSLALHVGGPFFWQIQQLRVIALTVAFNLRVTHWDRFSEAVFPSKLQHSASVLLFQRPQEVEVTRVGNDGCAKSVLNGTSS